MQDTTTTIAHYTSTGMIIPQLRGRTATAVIGELCSTLGREGVVKDLLPFYNSVLSLEQISNTGTSRGIALPHARVKGLEHPSFAVGRSDDGLDWFGLGAIRLVFLFAVPDDDSGEYRMLLSGLARLSRTPALRGALLDAPDSHAFHEILRQMRVRQARPQAPGTPPPGEKLSPAGCP
jgi:mannitol/fructose-specific phosphotransferase system IIA component (Ntr-type)